MIRLSIYAAALGLIFVTAISGCRSIALPVIYYTLSPITEGATDTQSNNKPAGIIGIRSVDLPGYIDRTQIVTRQGPNQLKVSSLHRWADYPDRMVQQVLVENLQMLMPDTRVVGAPWPVGLRPDLSVSFRFLELVGTADKTVLLSAVWIVAASDPSAVAQPPHRMVLEEPFNGNGYDGLAAAHSRALAALTRKVAESLSADGE
jgi:uncharacterized lipoprotein YmbA